MTRETKIGLIVAASFLCLVGVVVASKWHQGDGVEAEEQTVTPGAVAQAEHKDLKSHGKGETAPQKSSGVAAAPEKKKGPAAQATPDPVAKSKGLPGLKIVPPPGATPTTVEKAIEKEQERERLEALAKLKAEQEKGTTLPLPKPGEIPVLPALPNDTKPLPLPQPMVADNKPLPISGPFGDLKPLPAPGGDLKPLPTPGGDLKPLPVPGGDLKPLPVPGGDLKPLPVPGGDLKPLPGPLPVPQPVGGDLKPLPVPPIIDKGNAVGGDLKPLPAPSPFGKDGDNKPGIATPPGPLEPVKPFSDPTQPPEPKKTPSFGPFEPLPDAKNPPGPFAPLPKKDPGPIAIIPPSNGGSSIPSLPPISIGGAAGSRVRDANVDFYECQKGDSTFAVLSMRMYGTDKYADALLQYNREHSAMIKNGSWLNINPPGLSAGQQLLKPPSTLLDRDYARSIKPSVPQIRIGDAPSPLGAGPIAPVSNPPAISAGGVYTVRNPGGESIIDIAERTLGDRTRWDRIWRLNPNYPPQVMVPAGTQLKLPSN